MLGDTRTNAGFDNISCFSKLQKFHVPGERLMATLTAGNLAISQAVLNLIQDGIPDPETGQVETIYTVPTMFRAAALVAEGSATARLREAFEALVPADDRRRIASLADGLLNEKETEALVARLRDIRAYMSNNYSIVDAAYFSLGSFLFG